MLISQLVFSPSPCICFNDYVTNPLKFHLKKPPSAISIVFWPKITLSETFSSLRNFEETWLTLKISKHTNNPPLEWRHLISILNQRNSTVGLRDPWAYNTENKEAHVTRPLWGQSTSDRYNEPLLRGKRSVTSWQQSTSALGVCSVLNVTSGLITKQTTMTVVPEVIVKGNYWKAVH